jgi:hypothetical protein
MILVIIVLQVELFGLRPLDELPKEELTSSVLVWNTDKDKNLLQKISKF